jgi:hypothetical protein
VNCKLFTILPPMKTTPEKSPQEKLGWNYMLAGFFIVLLAGAAYLAAPRTGNPVYSLIGNYAMAAVLVVYVTGRVLRWRGRRAHKGQ